MKEFVPDKPMALLNNMRPKLSFGKKVCLPMSVGIRQFKCRFEGMLLLFELACLVLLMAPITGIMAQSSENGHILVSKKIYLIDENVGKDGTLQPFHIKIQSNDHCIPFVVYMCYLSQLDENYKHSDRSLQIRAGLTVNNRKDNNEIAEQCYPNSPDELFEEMKNPQRRAWHGLKVEVDHTENMILIQTSFSDEKIYLDYENLNDKNEGEYLKIHFGTSEKPLFTTYKNERNETFQYDFSRMMESPPRIPPHTTFDSLPKIRDAFQANPGAWLIPMDMARMEKYKGDEPEPTRMAYFVAVCDKEKKIPTITIVTENDNKNVIFKGECATPDVGTTTEPSIVGPNGNIPSKSTTRKSGSKETETTTTIKGKPACQTFLVNAEAAVIRDRFIDLVSACPDPKKCKVHVDYAVRLGCIDCKEGITQAEQNHFLENLREWLKNKLVKAAEEDGEDATDATDAVRGEFKEWKGTDFAEFLRSKPQTIGNLEPGGFRYVTVPKDWAEKGLHMLVHKCEGLGEFASAFHKDTVESATGQSDSRQSDSGRSDSGQSDRTIRQCGQSDRNYSLGQKVNKVVDVSVIVKDAKTDFTRQIRFGTYKLNAKQNMKEDHIISPEDMQAHKFKYGWSDPIRENELVGENVNNYERVKYWGRYIARPEQMYGNYNNQQDHIYYVVFKRNEKEDLVNGYMMEDGEFDNAKVDMAVEQMVIKCGNIYYMTPRFNALRRFKYTVQGKPIDGKPELTLQTKFYQLDYKVYWLPNKGQNCVVDPVCLADVNIYQYKDEKTGK